MHRRSRLPRCRAFTLVELVATLAVAGVLFALAVPSFAQFIAEQKLLNEARRVADAITLARSEAMKRNGHVVMCASLPGVDCPDIRHWHDGWVMFADPDGDAELGATELPFVREPGAAPGVTIVGNRPVEQFLRFDWLGQPRLPGGALQMGTIVVCRAQLRGYRVVLANTGRTRIERMPATCP